MGRNGVTESILFNPALLALSEEKSIGFHYFNRYSLKELKTITGNIYLPNDILPVGINFSSFGYEAYQEHLFRLLLGKHLNEHWTLGVSFQYTSLVTELFDEHLAQIATDIGIVYSPVDNLLIGLLAMNLPSVSVGDKIVETKGLAHYLLQLGFQWRIINSMLISAFAENSEEQRLTGGFGIEYLPFDNFCLRAGLKASPFLPSLGIGFRFSSFTLDVAAVYHSVLGISSGVGLIFSF